MDMTATIIPSSDQLNADDLMAGPQTVTIERVSPGSAEQPVDVHLVEFPGRAYRPSKSMRRVMVAAWGADTGAYVGQRLTLYRDPTIRFGKDEVGGIRISGMTGIDRALKVALTVTRGKREPFTVQPLADSPKPTGNLAAALAGIEVATTVDDARAVWDQHAARLSPADKSTLRDAMVAAKARIEATQDTDADEPSFDEPTLDGTP